MYEDEEHLKCDRMRSPGLTRVVQPCHMMNAIPVPARSNKRKVGKEIQRQMPHLKPRF